MNIVQTVAKALSKNSPAILTAIGVAGVFVTAAFAVKATVDAHNDILVEEKRKVEHSDEFLTKEEIIRISWKYYIPTVIMGIASGSCIIGAHSVHTRREAALMSVYTLTEAALREYRDKVVETIGENKERKIHDAVMQDRVEKNPPESTQVIFTGVGEVTCFESMTGRYFKSDHETIRKAVNDINYEIINHMYASHNDFCEKIGLPQTTLGDQMGWTTDNLLEVEYTSMLHEGVPVLVIDYLVVPKSNYYKTHN